MNLSAQLAKHIREAHFGGNWTCSNVKDNLHGLTWQQVTTQVHSFNTIATLTFHINYFVVAILDVLQGRPLTSNDKFSFSHPPVACQEDWEKMREKTLADAELFASLVEQMPESKLWEDFTDKKYGSYYRNIHGIIEHTHYHLGQIALVKKLLLQRHDDFDSAQPPKQR